MCIGIPVETPFLQEKEGAAGHSGAGVFPVVPIWNRFLNQLNGQYPHIGNQLLT